MDENGERLDGDLCSLTASPLEDIEDMIGTEFEAMEPSMRYKNKQQIVPKVRKMRKKESVSLSVREVKESAGDILVPGCARVWVKTWGCAHNSSDSEYMAGQLASQGYTITEQQEEADLWLLNSCTVKNPAEEHFRNSVGAGLSQGKKVVVAGCVPQGKQTSQYLQGLSMIGVQQIDRVVEVVEETLKGNQVRLFGTKKASGSSRKGGGARLDLPKIRRNPLVEIIAINTGCLNQCTYCKTKHARGELGSYPPEEIVERAEQSFREGVTEIWLTSEDTGAYGRDIDTNLPDLLWRLVEVIPDGCRLRLGMTNPPYILDHLEEMAKILNHSRVYKFLHVPVQAGSDAVLADMRREYTRADFERVVDYLREQVPGITIATDIIAGFPTETREDWEETLSLCRKYNFPSLFINQFFPRPGTPASKMERCASTQEVKGRTRELNNYFQSYLPYSDRVGQEYDVLVTDTSHQDNYLVGHNHSYEQVLVPLDKELMGKVVRVRIVSTSKFSMIGELIADLKPLAPSLTQPLSQGQLSGVQQFAKEGYQVYSRTNLLLSSLFFLLLALCYRVMMKTIPLKDDH